MVDGPVWKEGSIPIPAISRRDGPVTIEERGETAVPARSAEAEWIDGGHIARIMGRRIAESIPKGEVA